MRLLLATGVVLALCSIGDLATAATSTLRGTYKATITGKPAPLDGRWKLVFLPNRVVHILRNNKVVVRGRVIPVATRRLKFVDRSGAYACSKAEGNGIYSYKRAGKRLTFKALRDGCVGRKLVLTTKPFVR